MAVEFPPNLRGMILQGRARSIQGAYIEADPAIGPPYIQSLTDDTPFEYSFQLVFNQIESAVFWSWFNSPDYCNKGRAEFTIPVLVEGGYEVDQLVRFRANGFPQLTSSAGTSNTYSCTVVGRSFDIGLGEDADYPIEFYLSEGADHQALKDLDEALNAGWPSV